MFGWLKGVAPASAAFVPADKAEGDTTLATQPQSVPVTRATRKAMGKRPPSFVDLLPWMDFDPADEAFILEDGLSRAALYELIPTATEGRSEDFLLRQSEALQSALNGALPEVQSGEWVLQIFVQDDPDISASVDLLYDYIDPKIRETAFTQDYLARMRKHVANLSRPDGIFTDTEVSGNRFGACLRRIRACVYRRFPTNHDFSVDGIGPIEQLRNVCERFEGALAQAGVRAFRRNDRDLYAWLLPWFNPKPECLPEGQTLLQAMPYPDKTEDRPWGWDFCEQMLLSMPRSDSDKGIWYFDGQPSQALTFQALRNPPKVGHLTAERAFKDGRAYALFDKLPEGSILSFSIAIRAQDKVREHIDRIKHAATGDMAEAELAKQNAILVTRRMAKGDKLFPVDIKLYVRGTDEDDLRSRINAANAVMLPSDCKFIDRLQDLLGLDAYVRGLPMAFDPAFDAKHSKRARLMFSSHLAKMLPAYGRARGTGRPAFWFWNRGGEPLVFDPLHRDDRKKNAHLLMLGPTGAGKSATCNSLCLSTMAVHRPRLFIVDAGNSFGLLGEHFKNLGLTVNQVTLNPDSDVSLPPFADAYKCLGAKRKELTVTDADDDTPAPVQEEEDNDPDAADAKRDVLGEMEIAARIMITGGDTRENDKLTRSDRYLIRRAILAGAQVARDAGKPMMLTEDVAQALQEIGQDASLPESRRLRAHEMADGMRLFCDGLAGHFFNRAGRGWPDADVTILEMGVLAREGYEDQLTIAYISFVNYINGMAEARQYEDRATVLLTDEAHIVTTNPMLAPFIVKASKMWRKLGVWLWLATQNLGDFPDAAKRMLNMMEWWVLLTMPKEEVEQLERFRQLSGETRNMLLSARKQMGAYTEGVVLTDTIECLIRNVPPAIALALAQTEKHEKAERAALMREHGISEIDAVYRVAEAIDRKRLGHT